MSDAIVELDNIWISYPEEKKGLGNWFRPRSRFWAVKDVSFQVKQGEVFGIIGRNGSGKSTLLKLFAGIIEQDRGHFVSRGRKSSLLTLGSGFKGDLSGLDNIYLNGLLFGFSKKQIDERIDEIIAFSELEEFIFKPIRTYSSGMRARLAFSSAIVLDPDILLIDEVLGVGDAAFQEKSKQVILEKINSGRTVILVTHSARLVNQLCERVAWLHRGEMKAYGTSKEVVQEYLAFMKGSNA